MNPKFNSRSSRDISLLAGYAIDNQLPDFALFRELLSRFQDEDPALETDIETMIRGMYDDGVSKIPAIKRVREVTGHSLKDSKHMVDRVYGNRSQKAE